MIAALIARVLARPAVTDWLIRRAMRTPYTHITSADGSQVYMRRYWLFNPYPADSSGNRPWGQFPISIRLHQIMREDDDRDLHDHPWNARTFILRGWYVENRPSSDEVMATFREAKPHMSAEWADVTQLLQVAKRQAGDTAALRFGEYHRITEVSEGGVWTLFVTGRYRGTWGFLVNGKKVPWREYLLAKGES